MKVNKNILLSLLILLVMIFFTGCTNYDPWLSSGITKQEADLWMELKFTVKKANLWNKNGFSPSESFKWQSRGFVPFKGNKLGSNRSLSAVDWKRSGFNLNDSIAWRDSGFDSSKAKEWKDSGFEVDEANSWIKSGLSPKDSKEWKSGGYSISEAKKYNNWKKSGFDIEESNDWMKIESEPEKAKQWKSLGLTISEVKNIKKQGMTPSEYSEWKSLGLNLSESLEIKKKGITSTEAIQWTGAGLTIDQAIKGKKAGFELSEASQWKKEGGYDVDQAIAAKNSGLTLEQIKDDAQKTKVVIVTGVGETEHEAIKDAGRTAVKETLGMFLVSETVIEDDKLIKDEVLSVSDGFVSKFRTISKGKDEDGLVQVKAAVSVVVGKVASKLRGMNVSLKDVGSEQFVAVELDKFASAREYKKLFDEVIVKPLFMNDTYELELTDFKPLDVESIDPFKDYQNKYGLNTNHIDYDLIKNGELFPYYINFKISLNDSYFYKVNSFLNSFSERIIKDAPVFIDHECVKNQKNNYKDYNKNEIDLENLIKDWCSIKMISPNNLWSGYIIDQILKGYISIGNINVPNYCNLDPNRFIHSCFANVHENATIINGRGDNKLSKSDFNFSSNVWNKKELAKIKNENIICWKNFSSEYCYFKNMNPFMNYNFIKTYEISNQHKYILTGLFRKYEKKGPTRFLEIKLIDKNENVYKGRFLGLDRMSASRLEQEYRHTVGTSFADNNLKTIWVSLTTTDIVPSRLNKNNITEFGRYGDYTKIHNGFIANLSQDLKMFFIFKNKYTQNSVIMYLSEYDISKLNNLKIKLSIECGSWPQEDDPNIMFRTRKDKCVNN